MNFFQWDCLGCITWLERGKTLPAPDADEIRSLAGAQDVELADEPALAFECGEADHLMLA